METAILEVKSYAGFTGEKTIQQIERDVKEIRKGNPKQPIILDFKGSVILSELLHRVASICTRYDCQFIHLDERGEIIERLQRSGHFELSHMGQVAYVRKLKQLIEYADYPLMIRDSQDKKGTTKQLAVIQPLLFTEHKFIYNVLRARYIQPIELLQALRDKQEDIFIREEVYVGDIDAFENCFRFACTLQERTTLDVLQGILTGQLNVEFLEVGGGEKDDATLT